MRGTRPVAVVPSPLSPGEPVHVVAPSGVIDRRRLEAGIAYLAAHGHRAMRAGNLLSRHGYLSGTDEERADRLNEAISSPDAAPILFARGGYGLTRLLDRLDLAALRRRPRLLLGYSDATALFMALQRRGPYPVLYGPLVTELGDPSAFDERTLWGRLYGTEREPVVRFRGSDVLRGGRGTGRVIGGCLSLLVSLLGTRFDHDYRGAILFWEEIGEEPFRLDRMLTQLRNAGKLDHLSGMVIGSLTGCRAAPGKPSLRVREIIGEIASGTTFPIVWNIRAGHVARKVTLPLGVAGTLDTARGSLTVRMPVYSGGGAGAGRRGGRGR